MERYEVAKFIEALSPYIYINKEALLTNVILNPIDDLPDEMNTVFDKALFAVVWRDIEGDKAGILPHWDERKIVEVTHKISRSGNPAWYCKCEDGKTVYVRQSNKEIMTVPYPAFENMQVGDVVSDVNITIYTTTDGIFLNIEKVIEGGVFAYVGESDSQRKQRVIAGLDELTKDAVYFDVETTTKGCMMNTDNCFSCGFPEDHPRHKRDNKDGWHIFKGRNYLHGIEDALLFVRENEARHQWVNTGIIIDTVEPFPEKRCKVCGATNWGDRDDNVCFGNSYAEMGIVEAHNRRAMKKWGNNTEVVE